MTTGKQRNHWIGLQQGRDYTTGVTRSYQLYPPPVIISLQGSARKTIHLYIKTDSNIFLNFLYDIRNISPEMNIISPCSFPPGVSQTCWDLTIGFYGKHLISFSNKSIQQNCHGLPKNFDDPQLFSLYLAICDHRVHS